jgi:hypothetical protein
LLARRPRSPMLGGRTQRVVAAHLLKPMVALVEGSALTKSELIKAVFDALGLLCGAEDGASAGSRPPSMVQVASKLDEVAVKEARGGEARKRWYVKDAVLEEAQVARFVPEPDQPSAKPKPKRQKLASAAATSTPSVRSLMAAAAAPSAELQPAEAPAVLL